MTLDPVHDGRHELRPDGRESLAFILTAPDASLGAIIYTWVGADGKAGSMLVAFEAGQEPVMEVVDGVDVPADMGFDDWRVGAMTVRHVDPLRVAEVSFAGERLAISYRFEATCDAYNYGAHPEGCPWYLADDRFEQSGVTTGVLTVDGREIAFDTTGHRDHSWGTRNWGAPLHWKWINAQVGRDVAVHVMETSALGKTELRGYVQRDGVCAEVVGVTDAAIEFDPDVAHRRYAATIHDRSGRATAIVLESFAKFEFRVSPVLTLHEVSVRGTVAGVDCIGHVEMAWPADYLERAKGAIVGS